MTTAIIEGGSQRAGGNAASFVVDVARGLLLIVLVAALTVALVTGGRLMAMVGRRGGNSENRGE